MPTSNLQVHDGGQNTAPKDRPEPLVTVPLLSVLNNDEHADESQNDSDIEDVMTVEEEAAARRYLSGPQTEQRRLSSLDRYLLQPGVKSEPMIINRRVSLRKEAEDIAKQNENEEKDEEMRKEQFRREREEVKRARESKQQNKEPPETIKPPSSRRINYRKQGLGKMSKERRKKLKEMIMQKAKEELLEEHRKEKHKRDSYIKSKVPSLELDGLSEDQLKERINSWYQHIITLEQAKYDWELRLQKQDEEINDLTARLGALKGKYQKPILRKVRKTLDVMARLDRIRTLPDWVDKQAHHRKESQQQDTNNLA